MGALYDMSAIDAGVVDGVIQRGDFTAFHPYSGATVSAGTLPLNAETTVVKAYIEGTVDSSYGQTHIVDVTVPYTASTVWSNGR